MKPKRPKRLSPEASFFQLQIHRLELQVHLGCLPAEREKTQPVFFDVILRFDQEPAACASDEICETLCYAEVCKCLADWSSGREFRLIEHLAFGAYDLIKQKFGRGHQIKLSVRKPFPPIDFRTEGMSFCFGDFD